MRRHGWGGELPTDDDEARRRIVDAARVIVRATSVPPTITEVAAALSVTRPTVYRYFASAEALLLAAASDGVEAFLDDILSRVATSSDPTEVVVEGIAFTFEEIDRRTELALVLAPSRGSGPREITSEVAIEFGRTVLEATSVDWATAGFATGSSLDELVQFMLRILQSLLIEPGDPPLRGDALRAYLRRWVGPAVERAREAPTSAATQRDVARR
jgi:AcrR family transcriptional regulator